MPTPKLTPVTNFGHGYFLYMPRESDTATKLTIVMHSEDIADHDHLKSLIEARRAEAESDTEREGIDALIGFEQKHRESLIHNSDFGHEKC